MLTHLHYDHAGNLDKLPRAHVQDGEMDYATGRCMCHAPLRHAYEVEDVVTLVRRVYETASCSMMATRNWRRGCAC